VNGDGAYSATADQSIALMGIKGVGVDLAFVLDAAGLLWIA